MIRQGEDKNKEALQAMWKCCFPDDTDEFIAFYFDRVYKNDETLVYIENGQPVASLQIIPYSFKTGATIAPAAYISGAMTHPGFRRKGYMSHLLNASFKVMKANGYDYTFLIPQNEPLFRFYEKFGYVRAFPEKISSLSSPLPPQETKAPAYDRLQSLPGNAWEIYSRFLQKKNNAVLKTESQFNHILWDFFNDKGVLFACDEGWAFTFREENKTVVKEFFYRNETAKQTFLQSIQARYGTENPVIFDDSDAPFVRYKGMIKSLTAKKIITDIYAGSMMD
jgi:predicted acetyltransferase